MRCAGKYEKEKYDVEVENMVEVDQLREREY